MANTKRNLYYIEIIRAICCIAVFVEHFSACYAIGFLRRMRTVTGFTPFLYLNDGRLAINVFCTIGGFLIFYTSHSTDKKLNKPKVRRTFIKRIIYLYFSCAIICIVSMLLLRSGAAYNHEAYLAGADKYADNIFSVEPSLSELLKCLGGIFIGKTLFAPQLWTMRYDFLAGSICLIILLLFGERRLLRYSTYLIYLIITVFIMKNSFAEASVLGMIAGEFCLFKPVSFRHKALPYIGVFIAATGSACSYTLNFHTLVPVFDAMALYLLYCLFSEKMQNNRFLDFIVKFGGMSFSFYLCHFIIIVTLSARIYCLLAGRLPHPLAYTVNFILSFVVVGVISYLYDRFIVQRLKSIRFLSLS